MNYVQNPTNSTGESLAHHAPNCPNTICRNKTVFYSELTKLFYSVLWIRISNALMEAQTQTTLQTFSLLLYILLYSGHLHEDLC